MVPIRVFLSSKMKEFEIERKIIGFQIGALPGFEVNAAEDWPAASGPVRGMYLGGVRRCHIYIGLFGRLYSEATKDEYDEACTNPLRQKLIYLKSGRHSIDDKLTSLIETIHASHRPSAFKDAADLQRQVFRDLHFAVAEMLDQALQRGQPSPIPQSG